jgi:hypothetical protein
MNSREKILGVRNIDPGASLHLSTHQMINTIGAHSRKGEAPPSHYAFEIEIVIKTINVVRLVDPSCAFTQDEDEVAIKWLTVGGICI